MPSSQTPDFTDYFQALVSSVSQLYLRHLNPARTETQAKSLGQERPYALNSVKPILKSTEFLQICFIQAVLFTPLTH